MHTMYRSCRLPAGETSHGPGQRSSSGANQSPRPYAWSIQNPCHVDTESLSTERRQRASLTCSEATRLLATSAERREQRTPPFAVGDRLTPIGRANRN